MALDANPHAVGKADAEIFLNVEIADAQAVLKSLEPFREDLVFVTTVATDFTHVVGIINDAFGLPGPTAAQGEVLTHKGKMRNFCQKHGHPHPPYCSTRDKDFLAAWMEDHHCPDGFVIKPAQNMGARGVMFIRSAADLAYAFEFAARQDKTGEVVAEHFVPAREISVDALCNHGQVFLTGVADRIIEIKDGHFFIENGHNLPAQLTRRECEKILALLQDFATSLESLSGKPYHGALKGDLRLKADGSWVIGEIAGRLSGGFMSTHTYPAAHQKDLMGLFIELLCGEIQYIPSFDESLKTHGVAIERSLYATPGVLSQLPREDELERLQKDFAQEGVITIHCNYRNGDLVSDLQSNVGKVFHVVIHRDTLAAAEEIFARLKPQLNFRSEIPPYDARFFAKRARERFHHDFCWVCKVCDGNYCASGVPGMGGQGAMHSFRDNIAALAEYRVLPVYTEKSDTQSDLRFRFLRDARWTFAGPVLSAPITGSITNMGGSITEYDYAIETGTAMRLLDLLPTFGDGATHDKYRVGLHAIARLGCGIPIFKPRRDQKELIRRIQEAEKAGATAWGIDIDGVSFKTMALKGIATAHKSLAELRELASASPLPMVIKGVLTKEDAEIAIAAGAKAIVVSNHGGRVADGMPGVARILPDLARFIRRNAPDVQILADGGIRSGADIFKMLALGAEAVLVGRPIAIMAVGAGRVGVASMLRAWLDELRTLMAVQGIADLASIGPQHIAKFI
ncbi:MAG: alpha-hydroxy-acid oxidizing protein [Leptospiraceae bacterium]|nr:alpha-hydroxy-acid oxidizing protein [Leptospiraceae bacterium]